MDNSPSKTSNKTSDEKLLPKPLPDLPLPEKQIPAHLASQGQASGSYHTTSFLRNKFFWGFLILSGVIAFLVGGFYLGNY